MIIGEKKYEKWKSITESDFVTMFIKTWFTYIAVLREVYPDVDVFTSEGLPRGDKPFLNAFNDGMLSIIQRQIELEDITQNLFEFYPVCMNKVIQIFPQYFFQTFYRYNEDFSYEEKNIIKHYDESIKERWQLNLKVENKHILKFYLGLSGKLYNKNYSKDLKYKFNLKDIVLRTVGDQKGKSNFDEVIFLKIIYDELQTQIDNKLFTYIREEVPNLPYCMSIKKIIESGCKRAGSTLRLNFESNYRYAHEMRVLKPESSYMVFRQLPFQLFYKTYLEQQYTSQKGTYDTLILTKGLEWFSGFVYRLRNALFHEIIDPLDEDWQTIFKSAYLILKPITDICIDSLEAIEPLETINNATDNSIQQ